MMNQFYRETLINSSAELFKAVDEKSRIEGLPDFTEQEEKLANALNYWAEWGLHPMDNPEYMTWEEIMQEAQEWARNTMD